MTAGPLHLIGFDACDASTVQAMAAAGRLPSFADALARGRCVTVRSPFAFFVGSVWPTFATGLDSVGHGFTCWSEIDPSTYEWTLTHPDAIRGEPFWRSVAAAGKRVAVIDVPHFPARPFDGVQVAEWGAHDRHYGLHSWPETLAGELVDRFGTHPVLGLDAYAPRQFAPDDFVHRVGLERTLDEDLRLLADLREGAERKMALSLGMLEREPWDLFISIFGDSHAGGHHLWHHHDARHPRHDPAVHTRNGGDAMVDLYRGLDDALASHLAAAGDATVLVLLSHGMGPHFDATHLLEEMLRRIQISDNGGPVGPPLSVAAKAAWRAVPAPIRRRTGAMPAAAARRRARRDGLRTCWQEMTPGERAAASFYNSPNNSVFAGVRLNLVGREGRGTISRERADEVLERLGRDLLDVVNVETGRPVVRRVIRTDTIHGRDDGDRLPDLLVDWDRGAPVETVWSPKVGLLHGPYGQWRTGDHVPDGLLIALGDGIDATAPASEIDMADLAPSICARFGIEMSGLHGRVIDWLAGAGP